MKYLTKAVISLILCGAVAFLSGCSEAEETSSANVKTGVAPGGDYPASSDESVGSAEESDGENGSADVSDSGSEVTSVDIPAGSNAKIEVKDGVTYVNGILIANKTYGLPESYDPGILDEPYDALLDMEDAAAADGIVLFIMSGYRDYETQEVIYNRYVEEFGKEEADRFSARPGHSEHQTGYAFDLNSLEESFADTPEGIWLAENCYKYGFIIRYPKDKEDITGYMYEPWHVRYLGKELSEKVYNSGLTLEEYLGITSQYSEE